MATLQGYREAAEPTGALLTAEPTALGVSRRRSALGAVLLAAGVVVRRSAWPLCESRAIA